MKSLSEINKPLYKALRQLGLTDSEANTYTIALQLGPSPVSTIAENLEIARPNAYKIIEALHRWRLVKFSEHKYGRNVTAEPPSVVLDKLRQKEASIEETKRAFVTDMPDLLKLYQQGSVPSKIKVLEGQKQFLRAFDQILEESKDESLFCGSAKDFIGFVSWQHEREWIRRRIKKGVSIRALLLPGKEASELQKDDQKELRQIKFFRGVMPFTSSFQLFGNEVIIWQPRAPLAIQIEDQYVVGMLRNIFEYLWGLAKKD